MMRALPIVLNVLAFDALWTLSLLGAGTWWWWWAPSATLASFALQLRGSPSPRREAVIVLLGSALGLALDVLSNRLGLFQYHSGFSIEFVLVFAALWINFGTTLRPSLSWMWRRPLLAACLGALAAPPAYWIGSKLGAITLHEPSWRTLAFAAAQYAILLPLWMLLADRWINAPGATDPQPSSPAKTRSGDRPTS